MLSVRGLSAPIYALWFSLKFRPSRMTGLFPEWLCLRNLSHTATAAGRSGVKAGIFQAHEHTGGECPSRAILGLRLRCGVCCKICSQVFMHGDVVEAAKAVPHFIERREKRLPQLRRFLPGNAVSKNSAA